MARILIDNHHSELTYSFELLLGRRLRHQVFYPIGTEWHEKGFWKVYPHVETMRQYLGMQKADLGVYSCENVVTGSGKERPDPRLHYCWDPTKEIYDRAITFGNFIKNPADIVIASIPQHVECFQSLIKKHCPKAKLVFQMGNMFSDFHFSGVRNVLNSTDRRVPFYLHHLRYSQEFDTVFDYAPPAHRRKIINFAHYSSDAPLYQKIKTLLPEFTLQAYGAGNETGSIARTKDVFAKMREADFIWHLKKGGDGYGHVVHNAAALGRPLIISKKEYSRLRFGKFIEDGVTCISVDGCSPEELAKKIRRHAEPTHLETMGRALYQRFRDLVDFEGDGKKVQRFLENLR